jgi:CheY-like chemotaxis protein/two-component sensor histidine kinase
MQEMQKLESLGKITGNLAHDFNNLLMAIIGNLEPLSRKLPRNASLSLRRLIDGAIEAAERGASLTSRLLAFARRQELRPEPVDISRLIYGIEELLQRAVGPTIDVRLDFEPDLTMVLVDPNQLELALLNLALNSRDAMPQGGSLTIEGRLHMIGHDMATGLPPREYVRIAVIDTGVGMPETILRRATEPFFTTKQPGQGTGLGLSMVYGLASQSGGHLGIASELGAGTRVELLLPVTPRQIDKPPPNHMPVVSTIPIPSTPAKSYHILLVDDDRMVGQATAEMLSDLGHTVVLASSGAQALKLLEIAPPIDILITDHAMPGMTGAELARQVRRRSPNFPVLLATGYADPPLDETLGLPRLNKPYRMDTLAGMIDSLIPASKGQRDAQVNSRRRRSVPASVPGPLTARTLSEE